MPSNLNTAIQEFTNLPTAEKIDIKCNKDGLLFFRVKHTTGGITRAVRTYDATGDQRLLAALNSKGRERHKLVNMYLSDPKGYTQQEIALLFGISQAAVSFIGSNPFDNSDVYV